MSSFGIRRAFRLFCALFSDDATETRGAARRLRLPHARLRRSISAGATRGVQAAAGAAGGLSSGAESARLVASGARATERIRLRQPLHARGPDPLKRERASDRD